MLVLLSPAKRLDFEPSTHTLDLTRPALIERTADLSKATAKLSKRKIKTIMELSDDLAELNYERFQAFDPDATDGKAAALAFAGEVYRGLNAEGLSDTDLKWAQDHLRILSGMYGVLRPLDAIEPYRLVMGSSLKNPRGKDLYAFWGDAIAKEINKTLKGRKYPVVINLASNEYFSAVDRNALEADVITPTFKDEKDGKLRALQFFAKRARGSMTRWIIDNRIEEPEAIKKSNADGYKFRAADSTATEWLFTRKQPPLKK